ncbi:hypothetical protein, partial [Escherichia coli]|uniref:hypothetical protein n=1 Tax=Escherichia coli TaxID=562 RepID=UPI0012FF675A
MKYIVGSGWWCNEKEDYREKCYGDNSIRGKEFHQKWYESLLLNTSPAEIYIVDSDSPIKPNFDKRIKFVSLNENGGHSTNLTGKYSGWMRSVIHSMSYAQCCDCDYYIYVEQDVLLKGKGIVEYCISKMTKPFMFGLCHDHHNPLQQSFFIIKKDYIDIFLSRLYLIKYNDFDISPEKKFALATSPFFHLIPQILFVRPKSKLMLRLFWRIQNTLAKILGSYDYLPIGYGRDRPINLSDKYYYFQHGTMEEINDSYI